MLNVIISRCKISKYQTKNQFFVTKCPQKNSGPNNLHIISPEPAYCLVMSFFKKVALVLLCLTKKWRKGFVFVKFFAGRGKKWRRKARRFHLPYYDRYIIKRNARSGFSRCLMAYIRFKFTKIKKFVDFLNENAVLYAHFTPFFSFFFVKFFLLLHRNLP